MARLNFHYTFYVYILTNPQKSVLYVGFTSNLSRRLKQHKENRAQWKTFAGRFFCYNLVYYEIHKYVNNAIAREKQIKRWNRKKKENLINAFNPRWLFLNNEFHV
jgi:putative endonuclease